MHGSFATADTFQFLHVIGRCISQNSRFQERNPAEIVLHKNGNLLVLMIKMWQ